MKTALKKNVTFRNLHQTNNLDNTSRGTTSSTQFRINSTNAIHKNNIKHNIQTKDDRVAATERNQFLTKAKSHAN